MELQIQDLVSSIKKEGIDAANQEASKILDEARAKADEIISKAKASAKAEKEAAEKEIALLKSSAEVSAQQAKRDAMLSFKSEVQAAFERILSAKVADALTNETLASLILAALQGEDLNAHAVELSQVSDDLKAALAQQLQAGLELRPTKSVAAGFRLAAKDGSGYFDCSDEEIMQMLMPYFRNLNF